MLCKLMYWRESCNSLLLHSVTLHIIAVCAIAVLSVRLSVSVILVQCVETAKYIIKTISVHDISVILVFLCQNLLENK